MNLSQEHKDQIRAEELYRIEVTRELNRPTTAVGRALAFLNSNLGLWLLSALFITGLSTAYSSWSSYKAQKRQNVETIGRLDIEISHRIATLSLLDDGIITYTQFHTAKASLRGTSVEKPEIGELGDYRAIFNEFSGRSLFSLVWELDKRLKGDERNELKPVLKEVRGLEIAFQWFEMVAPVGDEDSTWQVKKSKEGNLRNALSTISIARWIFVGSPDEPEATF